MISPELSKIKDSEENVFWFKRSIPTLYIQVPFLVVGLLMSPLSWNFRRKMDNPWQYYMMEVIFLVIALLSIVLLCVGYRKKKPDLIYYSTILQIIKSVLF